MGAATHSGAVESLAVRKACVAPGGLYVVDAIRLPQGLRRWAKHLTPLVGLRKCVRR